MIFTGVFSHPCRHRLGADSVEIQQITRNYTCFVVLHSPYKESNIKEYLALHDYDGAKQTQFCNLHLCNSCETAQM